MNNDIFGVVTAPPGVKNFAGGAVTGITIFASNIIKFITLLAGIFVLFNLISAGFTYLQASGNPKAAEEAGQRILMSVIGLVVIVASFTITAVISLLLFGKADFILNPTIPTP